MTETTYTEEITAIEVATPQSMTTYTDTVMSDVSEQGYWASFPVETMDDKKRLYKARNANELLREHMGEVIPCVGFVFDAQTISDAQYGARKVPCVHIISQDGTVYQSTSSGVVDKATEIISTFGMPETWGGPIEIACKETYTKNGFR